MEKQYKAEYNFLRDTNKLKEISKDFVGNWEKDKNLFINIYEQNMEAISNTPLTLESLYYDDEDED